MAAGNVFNNSQDVFKFKDSLPPYSTNEYDTLTCCTSSSSDTFTLKARNENLMTAINALKDCFKQVMGTIDHLIEKPVAILMEGIQQWTGNEKNCLRNSEKELQKITIHLSSGLKLVREVMNKQKCAVEKMIEQDLDEQMELKTNEDSKGIMIFMKYFDDIGT